MGGELEGVSGLTHHERRPTRKARESLTRSLIPFGGGCHLRWLRPYSARGETPPAVDLAKYLGYRIGVKRVKIGEFRDRASELIRRAAEGETIVILNRDREIAKVVPITARAERAGGLIGCLAGTARVRGDIETPIASPKAWFHSPK